MIISIYIGVAIPNAVSQKTYVGPELVVVVVMVELGALP
jgi:hypothetical protein